MSNAYRYGGVERDADLLALARQETMAFGGDVEGMRGWLEASRDGVRALWRGRELVGGLLLAPMGQFFGGRSVTMTGVAGVTIAPHVRGHGAATALMHAAVAELAESGMALSALYPSTFPLYRRAGYELAGARYRMRVRARDLPAAERAPRVRPVAERDMEAIQALYREQARARQGWLDRGEYTWRRVRRSPRRVEIHGHVIGAGQAVEGYVFYSQTYIDIVTGNDIYVTDMAAATPRAARRLLSFLASHRSLTRDIYWHGGVDDPFLFLLPERGYDLSLYEHWMLRIIDVKAALGQRGYPPGVEARLELDVKDEVVRANRGRYIVNIAGGRAEVRKGGRGALKLHVRALAALYSGHLTAHQLAALGAIDGPAEAVAQAALAFTSAAPSLPDYF